MSSFARTIEYLIGDELIERSQRIEFIVLEQSQDEIGRPLFLCRRTWRCEL